MEPFGNTSVPFLPLRGLGESAYPVHPHRQRRNVGRLPGCDRGARPGTPDVCVATLGPGAVQPGEPASALPVADGAPVIAITCNVGDAGWSAATMRTTTTHCLRRSPRRLALRDGFVGAPLAGRCAGARERPAGTPRPAVEDAGT